MFWSLGISELIYEANTENYRLAEDFSQQCLDNMLTGIDTEDPENKNLDIDAFLIANKLQEYDADQVIDALWLPIDTEKLADRFKVLPDTELQKSTPREKYKEWKSNCMKWPESAKANAEKTKKEILENTSKVFRSKLEELFTKPGGVNRARTFFKQLQRELISQEEMMRDESEANLTKAKNKEREFQSLGDKHDKQKPGSLFWKSKVAAQCGELIPPAKLWLKHAIESKRKDVAADLYHTLHKEAEKIVDQTLRLEDNIGTASTSLKKTASQRSRRIRSNFRREVKRPADANDQELLNKDAITRKFMALKMNQMTSQWASHESEPDTIREEVFKFVLGELKTISNPNIFSAITGKGPEQLRQDIRDIYDRSTPLWKYDNGIIAQCKDFQTPHKALVTAGPAEMPDSIKKVFERESGGGAIPAWVPVANANYFTLLQWEFNVPAFAIDCVRQQMLRDYNNEHLWSRNEVGFHLHCEWRKELPTIEPDSSQEERKEVWVLAMAKKLIEEKVSTFFVRNTKGLGKATEMGDYTFSLQTKIYQDAKKQFIENKNLCANVADMINEIRTAEGGHNFFNTILDYRSDLAPQVRITGIETERQKSLNEDLTILNKWIKKNTDMGDGSPPPHQGQIEKDPQTA